MLVFCKNPRGVVYICGFQIWGLETGYAPKNIPYKLYIKYRECLEEATYREGVLSKMFKKPFPEIAFKLTELLVLPVEMIDKLGPLVLRYYNPQWPHKKKIKLIRKEIIKASSCL